METKKSITLNLLTFDGAERKTLSHLACTRSFGCDYMPDRRDGLPKLLEVDACPAINTGSMATVPRAMHEELGSDSCNTALFPPGGVVAAAGALAEAGRRARLGPGPTGPWSWSPRAGALKLAPADSRRSSSASATRSSGTVPVMAASAGKRGLSP